MKRMTVLLPAAILCLCLAACGKATEPEQDPQGPHTEAADTEGTEEKQLSGSSAASENPAGKSEEPLQQSIELVGPWHLDSEKNDLAAFADSLFPGYGEWGASMELRSDGQMSWYIGAEGWHGTYTVEDGAIHAQLASDSEQSTHLWDFRIIAEDGAAELEMDYQDMTIYWVYGDQEPPQVRLTASNRCMGENQAQQVSDRHCRQEIMEDMNDKSQKENRSQMGLRYCRRITGYPCRRRLVDVRQRYHSGKQHRKAGGGTVFHGVHR